MNSGGIILKPGMCFGEMALIYNKPRSASIRAITECICATLNK